MWRIINKKEKPIRLFFLWGKEKEQNPLNTAKTGVVVPREEKELEYVLSCRHQERE